LVPGRDLTTYTRSTFQSRLAISLATAIKAIIGDDNNNNHLQNNHHRMHPVLRSNTKRGVGRPNREEKKKVKVSFQNFNEAAESNRQKRGVQLRARLKEEKASYKKFKEETANNPRRVYAALTDPANVVGLNALADNNEAFQMTFFALFRHVAALPNANVNGQPRDALGVLNALIAANIPFPNLVGASAIMDFLLMIGALPAFQPLMNPLVSDGSDHEKNDKKQKEKEDNKKQKARVDSDSKQTQTNNDDDDNSNNGDSSNGGGNKRQRVS
jgi:hypothetical protein